ncbi:unnamed protein product [Brassica oleracea]
METLYASSQAPWRRRPGRWRASSVEKKTTKTASDYEVKKKNQDGCEEHRRDNDEGGGGAVEDWKMKKTTEVEMEKPDGMMEKQVR